jgi:hypothetical protein
MLLFPKALAFKGCVAIAQTPQLSLQISTSQSGIVQPGQAVKSLPAFEHHAGLGVLIAPAIAFWHLDMDIFI